MAVKQDLSYSNYSQEVPTQISGLHLAAYFGLEKAAIALLSRRLRPDLYHIYLRMSMSISMRTSISTSMSMSKRVPPRMIVTARMKVPVTKKPRSRSGYKSRGSSTHGSFADMQSDTMNGYSSGDGAGSVSRGQRVSILAIQKLV